MSGLGWDSLELGLGFRVWAWVLWLTVCARERSRLVAGWLCCLWPSVQSWAGQWQSHSVEANVLLPSIGSGRAVLSYGIGTASLPLLFRQWQGGAILWYWDQ